jgi:hypothetical protein
VVAGLIDGGSGSGVGRCLLEEVCDTDRGRRAGFVEDRDDVERLVLFWTVSDAFDKTITQAASH